MKVTKISAVVGGALTAAMLALTPASAGAQERSVVHHVVHHIVVHHVMENHPVAAAIASHLGGGNVVAGDPRFSGVAQFAHDLSPYYRHGGNGVIVHPALRNFAGNFVQNHPVAGIIASDPRNGIVLPGGRPVLQGVAGGFVQAHPVVATVANGLSPYASHGGSGIISGNPRGYLPVQPVMAPGFLPVQTMQPGVDY